MKILFGISLFKIIFTLFFIYAISRVWIRYKENIITRSGFFFWSAIWLGAIFVVLYPTNTDKIAYILGVERGVEAALTIVVVVMLYTIYRLNIALMQQERRLASIVQKLALWQMYKKPPNSH